MQNKTQDKDLKVWYRLAATDSSEASSRNVALANTSRKVYLYSKNNKIVETLIKVDPTKPFFFKSPADFKVELDVTVRNEETHQAASLNAKRVHYGAETHDVGVGGEPQSANGYDEDDRDDEVAYLRYQSSPQYEGYAGAPQEEESLMGLLNIQSQQRDGDARDSEGGDSSKAVGGYEAGAGSREDSGDLDGRGLQCAGCGAYNADAATAGWTCESCGQWLGGQQG